MLLVWKGRQQKMNQDEITIAENKYTINGTVRFSEIDHTGKITLPGIINYFQDCSIAQTEALGYSVAKLKEQKRGWVLLSWQIIVERYAKLGEKLLVSTWATGFKGVCGSRNFSMEDQDGNRIAYADSLWVYMDLSRGKPVKPTEEEMAAYGAGEPIPMERVSRKIDIPKTVKTLDKFPVRKYHIDTNEHVNNCQYVQMALELYPGKKTVSYVRVEYKKSAVYKDTIIAKAAAEEERYIVQLCDESDIPYAAVEFK